MHKHMSKYRRIGAVSEEHPWSAHHTELLLVEAGALIGRGVLERERDPVGQATIGNLRLRYTRTRLDISWMPTFDRWANSVDWVASPPSSLTELQTILAEAERLGAAGDANEETDEEQ